MAQSIEQRTTQLPADYPEFLAEVKARIAAARTRAVLAVNSELIKLYWEIGHEILDRERREGWGAKVIDRLAADLRREFPEMTVAQQPPLHAPDGSGMARGRSCPTARGTIAVGPHPLPARQA